MRIPCLSDDSSASPIRENYTTTDISKDGTRTAVQDYKGSKMQTMIEVMQCNSKKPSGWTSVQCAAHRNREAALHHFLRSGCSPDDTGEESDSPLCLATAAGHLDIIKTLCEAGANVNATAKSDGETPLHTAIKSGRADIMDTLLPYSPDLNSRTSVIGETPLHFAARTGSLATVVTLLRKGANYEALNCDGHSPAEIAFQQKHVHVAVAIISAARGNRRKLAKEKEMLLRYVEKAQNRFSMNNDLIADIFEAGCDPESTVLVEAIKRDDQSLAEMFLEKGADPNRPTARGLRPIFAAMERSNARMVQLLVKHKVDVELKDRQGLTVLQAALGSPLVREPDAIHDVFEALLLADADPFVRYRDAKTLLHGAVREPHHLHKIAHMLLQCGVKVDERDSAGCTALHYATNKRECVELLLKHKADPNLVNKTGLTPLLHTVGSTAKETEPDLEALIRVSDLNKKDTQGKTALHIAARRGLTQTVQSLLKHQAGTMAVDADNLTPLLLAVQNQRWPIVGMLATQPGANSWDNTGMTALHIIAMTTPSTGDTWKDMAAATAKFGEKGVSRTMRDKSGATPLIQAIKSLPEDGLPVIEALLRQTDASRINCINHEDHKQRSALYFATSMNKPSFVALLLAKGAAFDLKDKTLRKLASRSIRKLLAEAEWSRCVRMLQHRSQAPASILPQVLPIEHLTQMLDMGLDPNTPETGRKTAPLLWVVLNQFSAQEPLPIDYRDELILTLLDRGANPNTLGYSSLVKQHNPQDTRSGKTAHPLAHMLEVKPSVDAYLFELFLEKKAKLDVASTLFGGKYPLQLAAKANRIDVLSLIIIRGADVNAPDARGRTAVFDAAECGSLEIVDLLAKSKAKTNVQDVDGNTPLHAAVAGGRARIVSYLLRAGLRASVKNNRGMTPVRFVSEGLADDEKVPIITMLKRAEQDEKQHGGKQHDARPQRLSQRPAPVPVQGNTTSPTSSKEHSGRPNLERNTTFLPKPMHDIQRELQKPTATLSSSAPNPVSRFTTSVASLQSPQFPRANRSSPRLGVEGNKSLPNLPMTGQRRSSQQARSSLAPAQPTPRPPLSNHRSSQQFRSPLSPTLPNPSPGFRRSVSPSKQGMRGPYGPPSPSKAHPHRAPISSTRQRQQQAMEVPVKLDNQPPSTNAFHTQQVQTKPAEMPAKPNRLTKAPKPPRVDSGFGSAVLRPKKPAAAFDGGIPTFHQSGAGSQDELRSWLKMGHGMDRM